MLVVRTSDGQRFALSPLKKLPATYQIGRLAVCALLNRGETPAIRLGGRWIVTRHGLLVMAYLGYNVADFLGFCAPAQTQRHRRY
jgi:hypothetical protein